MGRLCKVADVVSQGKMRKALVFLLFGKVDKVVSRGEDSTVAYQGQDRRIEDSTVAYQGQDRRIEDSTVAYQGQDRRIEDSTVAY